MCNPRIRNGDQGVVQVNRRSYFPFHGENRKSSRSLQELVNVYLNGGPSFENSRQINIGIFTGYSQILIRKSEPKNPDFPGF